MQVKGGDASSVVSSSEMRAMGLSYCVRYFSQYPSKNLTRGEVVDLGQNGLNLVAVYEDDINDWKRGYDGGKDNAVRFLNQAQAVGMPNTRPSYFAVDTDIDPNNSTLHSYFRGISDVLGSGRRGAYASTGVLRALRNEGLIDYTWRTMSTGWNGGAGNPGEFHLEQTHGINSKWDEDFANAVDFGQWRFNWTPSMPNPEPVVHLGIVDMCAHSDPRRPSNQTTNYANVAPVQAALYAEGFLKKPYPDGHYGQETISAYAGWQGKCGYRGRDADGIPGMTTLAKLGAIHNFHVVS
jgi:hypothetical protein